MRDLRKLIKEHLLLEKRIAQLKSNIMVSLYYDIDRGTHAYDRSTRPDKEDYNQREVSNKELKYFVDYFLRDISQKILDEEIEHNVSFVIKSIPKELALAILPKQHGRWWWELIIKTVYRESLRDPMRTGPDQLVIWKD